MPDLTHATTERRGHPRPSCSRPVAVAVDGRPGGVDGQTIDVSVGGMRVRSDVLLPLGRCAIVLDSVVALVGEVVESAIDLDAHVVISRVVFGETPAVDEQRLLDLTAGEVAPGRARGRGRRVLVAASLLAGLAIVASVGSGDGSSPPPEERVALVRGGGPRPSDDRPAPVGQPAVRTVAPEVTPTTAPAVVGAVDFAVVPAAVAPAPTTTPAPAAAPAAPAPAPAPEVRAEATDHPVHVYLAPEGEESAVETTVSASDGVDAVRVQLHVDPAAQGTVLAVAVSVENRTDEPLTFADGIRALVDATQGGPVVRSVELHDPAVTTVGPGETVVVEGAIDLGAPGEYDLVAATEVSAER